MKILLVNPPSKFLIDDNVFPTLGLLYLSSYLKKAGYTDISLLDLNGKHGLPAEIDADIVGFYSNTPQFPVVLDLKAKIESINRNSSTVYVIGGPHVSGRPQDAEPYFDYIVAGEGERAFLDILNGIQSGKRSANKIIRDKYMVNLDGIPFPDRDLVDIKGYEYFINERLATTVMTSRGCPFACKFCANNAWGKTLRFRSPQNVTEEIRFLMDRYGYRAFMFFDDTMTINKNRMTEICKGLEDLDIIYRCFIRSDTVDISILKKMRSSGCVEVGMGIESGSQRILDTVSKNETVEQNMRTVHLCHGLGIRVKGFFIIGLPGENKESIKETMKFLEAADFDDIDITVYKPYPGSYIYRNKNQFDIDFEDDYEHAWFKGKPGGYSTTTSTKALTSSDILNFRDEIEKKFKKPQQVKAVAWKKI